MVAEWLAATLQLASWSGFCTSLEATVADVDDAARTGAVERIDIRSPTAQTIADDLAQRNNLPAIEAHSLIVARGSSSTLVHIVMGVGVCRTLLVRTGDFDKARLRALGRQI
jgi:hypothetical protein